MWENIVPSVLTRVLDPPAKGWEDMAKQNKKKLLKEKINWQNLYPAKISFKNANEIKVYFTQQKLERTVSKPRKKW